MHHIRISDTAAISRAKSNGASPRQQYYSRALFETNVDAIMVTNTQGVIIDVNQQAVELTGCTRSELIGSSWFSFCPDAVAASVAFGQALTEDRVSNVELVIKSCKGTETPVTYNAAPVYDSGTNLVGVFATLRDVTELKRLEQELEAKQIEVERASEMKSDFLATISHELRTPLTAILGFSEALLCGILGTIAEGQKEYVQDIHDSGLHLLALIDDILDLAKINAGMMELQLETADLVTVLAQSVSRYTRQTVAQNIDVQFDADTSSLIAQLDLRKTQKIIDHMLSNAVKFSNPSGHVRIQACRVPRSAVGQLSTCGSVYTVPLQASDCDEFVQLTIHDKGIGISDKNLPQAYELFTQIDGGLHRRYEGSGLGVSMVQRLAELHGGTSAIASQHGAGTSFAVWLPVREGPLQMAYPVGAPH